MTLSSRSAAPDIDTGCAALDHPVPAVYVRQGGQPPLGGATGCRGRRWLLLTAPTRRIPEQAAYCARLLADGPVIPHGTDLAHTSLFWLPASSALVSRNLVARQACRTRTVPPVALKASGIARGRSAIMS